MEDNSNSFLNNHCHRWYHRHRHRYDHPFVLFVADVADACGLLRRLCGDDATLVAKQEEARRSKGSKRSIVSPIVPPYCYVHVLYSDVRLCLLLKTECLISYSYIRSNQLTDRETLNLIASSSVRLPPMRGSNDST